MPRVLTACPTTGKTVATHAVVAPAAFKRLTKGIAIYCSACGHSHLVERRRLWLEGYGEPLGRPRAEASAELKSTAANADGASDKPLLL